MTTQTFDAVVVGAGSVGLPAAVELARAGVRTLVVDQFPSPGQGSNKAAIGGIRATHSAPAKIRLCLDSIRVFSTWKEAHGHEIEWQQGGYCFVAYRPEEERTLKELLAVQKRYGLDIDWVGREALLSRIPCLNPEGLLGGTFSPGDGSASPLLSSVAFHREARRLGVTFRFGERVTGVIRRKGKVVGVRTDKGGYATETVVNAGGPWARTVAQGGGLDVPVVPDSHEAGITEPVAPFLPTMLVDIRPAPGSKNYYFYQHRPGQVVFCITPEPPVVGTDRRETSSYLPMIARRMVDLVPRLSNLRVRRTWRGLYPMTPDGSPIVGTAPELPGMVHAVGMCGQGYMLGPGVGALLSRLVTSRLTAEDRETLEELSPTRPFARAEALR
ncbi:FAD-binding oxidoreductase [Acidobacteria bacterium ACD]|nr:MAG: FAD-binding oxidoreductase [Acidobacteriota bacterium]MCE7956494.1 FAD-binding oxidoreductase [Acidobacteria bacterium ACB2]MDL1950937.1 FAD-binding oxidoreductase [Acidobacteria bacterium ACD]